MENINRNSTLTDKCITSTLIASVLTSLAPMIASIVDGIFVSNLTGTDAFSAINLLMPLIRIVTVLMLICHMGANILAAKELGKGDYTQAQGYFTTAIVSSLLIGILSLIAVTIFKSDITSFLCKETALQSYISDYLNVIIINFPLVAIASTLNFFVSGEGFPKRTSAIVLISSLSNVAFDALFIGFMNMGLAGAAWGTVISSAINIVLHIPHLLKGQSHYKIINPGKSVGILLKGSIVQGFAFNIINITFNLFLIFANSLMERHLGINGYYQWGICIQMQMILLCICSGSVAGAIYLGNTLNGEGDARGVSYVIKRLLQFHVVFYSAIVVIMTAFPILFTSIFGIHSAETAAACRYPFFCFSLYFMGYCFVCAYTNVFQMMGYVKEKIFFISIYVVIVGINVWLGSLISIKMMWHGLFIGSIIMVCWCLLFAYRQHCKNPLMSRFTLQIKRPHSLRINYSVGYDEESLQDLYNKIEAFAKICEMDDDGIKDLLGFCKQLTANIVKTKDDNTPNCFDFKIIYQSDALRIIGKNSGKPNNPVAGIASSADYRYAYGTNITSILWKLK